MVSAGSAQMASAARKKLKKRRIEGPWEQIFEPKGFRLSARIHQRQLDVSAELPQDLPAGAAGWRERFRIGGHCDARELAGAFGDGLEYGHSFGADGEPVGGVFHVASGEDMTG